ncbi:MAG TPA: outer membrane lipoprotein chaperone LolA [Burkholderiaceae bacterium]
MTRRAVRVLFAVALAAAGALARADAVDTLRAFVRDARSGRADFAQTVTSPDGKRTKTSSGRFEFERPNRFRFEYTKPFEQLIVGDGQKVWIYDADLNQVSSRKIDQALGATPAALLAGASLERDFELQPLPDADGMSWVQATPRQKEGSTVQSLKVGFRGGELAAIEITDSFGQRSHIDFRQFATNVKLPAQDFRFTPPAGADVIEQ